MADQGRASLLGIPSWASVCTGFVFGGIFYSLYGLGSYLTAYVPWDFPLYLSWEPGLPFLPQWAPVYLSLNLLLALVPAVLRKWEEMAPLFCTMVAQTVVAFFFFLLVPIEGGFAPRPVTNEWLGLADTLNLEHNYMPSLHVTFAVTAALVIGHRANTAGRLFFGLWAAAISLSTVLIHEHHLIDVAGGALLAWLGFTHLYQPLQHCPVPRFPHYGRLLVDAGRYLAKQNAH